MKYRKGYKYQLVEDYSYPLGYAFAHDDVATTFLSIEQGTLTMYRGYAWDGPSGPTIDTANFMRGSLVHDALYQLMRYGLLDQALRKAADDELYRICLEDGMGKLRAWYVYKSVRLFARKAASRKNKKEVLEWKI